MEKRLRIIFNFLLACLFVSAFLVGAFTDLRNSLVFLTLVLCLGVFDFAREMLFLAGSLLDRLLKAVELFKKLQGSEFPSVSIIMPAFNEGLCIGEALASMYEIEYPNYEIIFVDDGSSDKTLMIAQEIASRFPNINTVILSQANAGKPAALNNGIIHANGEFVLCVDADSKVHPNTLRNGVRHFQHKRVGAVGGFVSIGNRTNWLTWFQHLEYLLNIQFFRRTLSLFGQVSVVPGPIGMFRKSAILQVGGYVTGHRSFAEDAELTMRMLAAGWTIKCDERMISVTEAPETVDAFLRQRYRWIRGMYQATWNNLDRIAGQGKRGKLLALHLVLDTTISPLLNGVLTLFFLGGLLRGSGPYMLEVWVAFGFAIEFLKTLIVSRSIPELLIGLVTVIPRRLFFTYVLQTWALLSLLDEWLDKDMTWDKLERTGQIGSLA